MWRFLLWLLVIYLLGLLSAQIAIAFVIASAVLWLVTRHAVRAEERIRRG